MTSSLSTEPYARCRRFIWATFLSIFDELYTEFCQGNIVIDLCRQIFQTERDFNGADDDLNFIGKLIVEIRSDCRRLIEVFLYFLHI